MRIWFAESRPTHVRVAIPCPNAALDILTRLTTSTVSLSLFFLIAETLNSIDILISLQTIYQGIDTNLSPGALAIEGHSALVKLPQLFSMQDKTSKIHVVLGFHRSKNRFKSAVVSSGASACT